MGGSCHVFTESPMQRDHVRASLLATVAAYPKSRQLDDGISDVISFWFEDSVDELYEKRWFVADGSAAQAQLDSEVRDRFGALLARAECGGLADWTSSARGILASIVLLDQLSRHAHRGDRTRIEANDAKALRLTYALLARGWDASLDTAQLVFALMPLRHTPTEERLSEVLERTAPRLVSCESGARLLHRFRRHTEVRLLHLQGKGDADDILERDDCEDALDQSGAPDEPLARCVHTFLQEHLGIVSATVEGAGDSRRQNGAQNASRPGQRQRRNAKRQIRGQEAPLRQAEPRSNADHEGAPAMIVSLSGGVDSMVLVHILLALRQRHALSYTVHAVHIDYANRVESGAEADFVRRWCEARGVGVKVRVVDEVKREVTARDMYEAKSRAIRFGEYAAAMSRWGGRGIFFGHHEGDLHENVISNVMKGAQLLNIAGIAAESTVNGISIYRPMLRFPKSAILEYAHAYGVPYFKDTTPKWSTRGQLRNELQPLLRQVYGEGVGAHLTTIAKDSAQCAALVESHMLRPFWQACVRSHSSVHVDVASYSTMPIFFWREALRHVCEQMLGCGLVKERPIQLLIERLRKPAHLRRDGWLALKRENRALLTGTTLVIFAAPVFPGRHDGRVWVAAPHAPEGTSLPAPRTAKPTEAQMGLWTVRLTAGADGGDGDGGRDEGDLGSRGSAPAAVWPVVAGVVRYTLPGHASYAVGSATHPQVDALSKLRGETWGVLMGAFPQIVGVGEPTEGRVLVEIVCSPHRPREEALNAHLASPGQ